MGRQLALALALILVGGCEAGPRADGSDGLSGQSARVIGPLAQAGPATPVRREMPDSVAEVRLSFAPVVRQVAPAVVSITSRRARVARNPFADDPFFRFLFRDAPELAAPRRQVETSLGSGVLVREDGVVVTNDHVVSEADEIEVVLGDNRSFKARRLSTDAGSDLAFLKLETRSERLPALPLGDSDAIEVGDIVLAIGNPFGIGQTVTSGIVSAKERTAPTLDRDVSFIQTDAAINPGNSGGALVTLDGRLVGINTAIFTRSGGSIGIGFAIPSNLVRARLVALAAGTTDIRRAWLGTALRPVGAEVAQALALGRPRGVVVAEVYPGSAADRAGLAAGDVILSVDGAAVDDPSSLNYRLALKELGQEAELTVARRGGEQRVRVMLEAAKAVPAPELTRLTGSHPLAGAAVANMSPAFNEEQELDPFARGVVVLGAQRGSFASQLRLRRGDVIESVNGSRIANVGELGRVLQRRSANWQIGVRRNGQSTVLTVQG